MGVEPFKQGPMGAPLVKDGKRVGHISLGGAMLLMPVGGKTVLFEMHDVFGPIPCSKVTQEPLATVPSGFWNAYERWDIGGKLVDGNLCVVPSWCATCGGTGDHLRHLGGKHWEDLGPCRACNGKRISD